MTKKIRFPLEMDNGIEVRSVEELRNNFSIARVIGYMQDGKLSLWLRDRYANELADAVDQLDQNDSELSKKLCVIFGTSFDDSSEQNIKKDAERIERLKHLKKYTDEKKYQEIIDQVAFDQDELYDLLDEDVSVIYLCGERFTIPLAKSGITYIGINKPIAVIDSKVEVDWEKKKISVVDMIFDDKYQAVLGSASKDVEKKIFKEKESANHREADEENAIELFKAIVNNKKGDNVFMVSDHRYSLLGYNEDCLIYCERWKDWCNFPHCNNYRYFRNDKKEEVIAADYKYVQCCVYRNVLFTIVEASKSNLYASNLDGTGKKKILDREYTYGIPLRASIEDDVIYVYYQKPGDKDDIWREAWYDLRNNNEWETLNNDSVGILTI